MWPFSKNMSLRESGLFKGLTDWHSHILPGVDDGVKTMEDSLKILAEYERLGVSSLWLTPHVMEDVPNTPESLQKRFDELMEQYHGPIKISLAAENMMDVLFDERLEENNVRPIGKSGNHLLVETSYFVPPMNMDRIFDRIRSKGYFPVLAHPERYVYMTKTDYDRLHCSGIIFQSNIFSFVGLYGKDAKRKAEWLLGRGHVTLLGSDLHRPGQLARALETVELSGSVLGRLLELSNSIL